MVDKIRFSLTDEIVSNIVLDYDTQSVLAIRDKYKLLYKVVVCILKYHGCSIKNMSNVRALPSVREKIKETSLANWGCENPSQNDQIKEKKKQTFISNYGVDNIFKYEEFKKKLNTIILEKYGVKRVFDRVKRKETMIQKYGVEYTAQLPEMAKKISENNKAIWAGLSLEQKLKRMEGAWNITISSIEKRIGQILMDHAISFTHSFMMKHKKNTFQYDFCLQEIPVLIEVNGDFWHANPKYYNENDELKFPGIVRLAKNIWKKDKYKADTANKYGYKVISIWEDEINKKSDEEVLSIILERIARIYENTALLS